MQVANKSPIVLQSRGARFLDLVRQNKLNVSPQLTVKANRRFSLDARPMTTPKNDKKEYFNFSSEVKFNPDASPSSGILMKRKAENDSPANSSSNKRKRVGFRDPVSSTKEYLITAEEEKHKSNSSGLIRCLVYNEEEFADDEDMQKPLTTVTAVKTEPTPIVDDESQPTGSHPVIDENPQYTDISTTEVDTSSPSIPLPTKTNELTFTDKHSLMGYVKDNFSLDELLQLYANDDASARRRTMRQITEQIDLVELMDEYFPAKAADADEEEENLSHEQNKFVLATLESLSALMKRNRRVKHKMMDILSEKHAEDFLDHALQENSTGRVCEKLTIPKIVNFLVHRANVSATDDVMFGEMNRKILFHLVESTSVGREMVGGREEIRRLLTLLFRSKPKIEIFDAAHEFLRDLV